MRFRILRSAVVRSASRLTIRQRGSIMTTKQIPGERRLTYGFRTATTRDDLGRRIFLQT
jgi:hypothetical protein